MSASAEDLQRKLRRKKELSDIKLYRSQQRSYLMTARFNTDTKKQNEAYRMKKWPNGCIYCAPDLVRLDIPLKSKLLVLEMDNDANRIFGVGMCANKALANKYNVYENSNYNRYNYLGKHRIRREEFDAEEEAVFKALDQLCFYGHEHMKRGQGLKAFPLILLINCMKVLDIVEFIDNMFDKRNNIQDSKNI